MVSGIGFSDADASTSIANGPYHRHSRQYSWSGNGVLYSKFIGVGQPGQLYGCLRRRFCHWLCVPHCHHESTQRHAFLLQSEDHHQRRGQPLVQLDD